MTSDKATEKRFYDLLKKRDKRAMEFLYDHYAPVMYGVIIHIVRREELAEELLAKTFSYIWKNHAELDPDRMNVCVWVINVTRRMCKGAVNLAEVRGSDGSAVYTVSDKNEWSKGLPFEAESMKVFDLLFFGNASVGEVAGHVGMTEAEIKANLREAVSHLNGVTERV